MEENLLVLVDEDDNEIGYGEKMEVHVQGKLHRAFSVFLIDNATNEILLQKRAERKYHSGGLWSNSCCSHPRKGEKMISALSRRLFEELVESFGEDAWARFAGKFHYFAQYEGLAENEWDYVYFVYVDKEKIVLKPNPEEIAEVKWVTTKELENWLLLRPGEFSAWFREAWKKVRANFRRLTLNMSSGAGQYAIAISDDPAMKEENPEATGCRGCIYGEACQKTREAQIPLKSVLDNFPEQLRYREVRGEEGGQGNIFDFGKTYNFDNCKAAYGEDRRPAFVADFEDGMITWMEIESLFYPEKQKEILKEIARDMKKITDKPFYLCMHGKKMLPLYLWAAE